MAKPWAERLWNTRRRVGFRFHPLDVFAGSHEVWIRRPAGSSDQFASIAVMSSAEPPPYEMRFDRARDIPGVLGPGALAILADQKYHHLVGRYADGVWTTYVDGRIVDRAAL